MKRKTTKEILAESFREIDTCDIFIPKRGRASGKDQRNDIQAHVLTELYIGTRFSHHRLGEWFCVQI